MEDRKIPVFATETDEAKWWYDHREELADDMIKAMREGRTGPGSVARLRARLVEPKATNQAAPEKSSQLA